MPAATDFPALKAGGLVMPKRAETDPFALERQRQQNRLELLQQGEQLRRSRPRTPSLREVMDARRAQGIRQFAPGAMQGDADAEAGLARFDPELVNKIRKARHEDATAEIEHADQIAKFFSSWGQAWLAAPAESRDAVRTGALFAAKRLGIEPNMLLSQEWTEDTVRAVIERAKTATERLQGMKLDPLGIEKRAEAEARGKARGTRAVPPRAKPKEIREAFDAVQRETDDEAEIDRRMSVLFGHDWRAAMRGGMPAVNPDVPLRGSRAESAEPVPGGRTTPLRPLSALGDGPAAPRGAPAPKKGAQGQGTQASPHQPTTQAEFDKVKSGEFFVNPRDGKTYRKK